MTTWTFHAASIDFTFERYVDGNTAVQAWELEDGIRFPYARISVNLPEAPLAAGQFFLKDWSENAPIAQAMVAQGLIERVQPPVIVHSAHIVAYAYEFTDKGKQYIAEK